MSLLTDGYDGEGEGETAIRRASSVRVKVAIIASSSSQNRNNKIGRVIRGRRLTEQKKLGLHQSLLPQGAFVEAVEVPCKLSYNNTESVCDICIYACDRENMERTPTNWLSAIVMGRRGSSGPDRSPCGGKRSARSVRTRK